VVGRVEELGRIQALVDAARGGVTGAVVVEGEAGIGKTTLLGAAALFLSPKTIEHHLGSVYRKRGFRSRTELAHAFATAMDSH
jgi:ABC-type lipoprotein export system ATPase subunit